MKYKIKNTDLFLNGKLIPEGSTVELSKQDSENLSEYIEESPVPMGKEEEKKKSKNGKDNSK